MLRSAGLSTSSVGRKHARRGQQLRAPSIVQAESIKEQQVPYPMSHVFLLLSAYLYALAKGARRVRGQENSFGWSTQLLVLYSSRQVNN